MSIEKLKELMNNPLLGYGLCVQFKSYRLHAPRNTVPSSAVFEKDLAKAVLKTG
jgi:hypothetical protein